MIPAISNMDLVVLCGGRGTRLGAMTDAVPKPLLPIGGRPYLLRLLERWRAEGARRFILAAHYLSEQFEAFAREHGGALGEIRVVTESSPLGTGGGLRNAALHVGTDTFLAANGDSYVSQSWGDVVGEHAWRDAEMTLVAVRASRVVGGARQKGTLDITPDGRLRSFTTEKLVEDGWINGGMYVLRRDVVLGWPEGKSSLENEIMASSRRPHAFAFRSEGELMDIGTPESYALIDRAMGPRAS